MYVAVYRAGGDAVAWAVHGAVSWASSQAVNRAVVGAASQGVGRARTQPEEPPHPGLAVYLGVVGGW